MPRLLLATTVPRTLEAFLLPVARHFRARGWKVDALSGGRIEGSIRDEFDETFEISWSRNPLTPGNFRLAPRVVRRIVQARNHDVVHVHTPVAGFVVRFALRPGRISPRPVVVYTAHGFHFHEGGRTGMNAAYQALERLAGRWTDHLVVINRADEAAAVRHRIVSRERLHYMPGIGVDLEAYAPSRVTADDVARVRAELEIPAGAPYFLMVAEFNPGKRHSDLVRAAAAVHPRAHVVLAGTGPLVARVRSLARSVGVEGRVHLAGFRRDIPTLIRGAAAVVLPSEREGLPRSLLEALALEVPAIATRIRGCVDLLAGGCGYMVPVGDVAALSRTLGHVLENPEEAALVARRGRERVTEFGVERVVRLHDELYRSAMATHGVAVR